ncbi:MAG: RHS repeat-associated core domain-containing protein, partial [Deltaproteobacteria bacterium]|nr:RHS repeat-associated core domain-containing protein [Deltaproteobacteria bacterium]
MASRGGLQSLTPYQFLSNAEAINISDGNLFFENEDVQLPGAAGMNLKIIRSFNSQNPETLVEEFGNLFKDAVLHKHIDRRTQPRVDRIVYDNATVSLGSLGSVTSSSTETDRGLHNKVTLKTGGEGWQISWADYQGVILMVNVSPNVSQHSAYILLIRKDGAAEPFNIQTGESLWEKSGRKFTTPFPQELSEIENINTLVLRDQDNKDFWFGKSGGGSLGYRADFSWSCPKWGGLFKGTCHGSDSLIGWKVYGFHLTKVEDDAGHFLEANILVPTWGQNQTITDQSQRKMSRIVNEDGSETWEASWLGGQSRQWRVEFDEKRRISKVVDPEAHILKYKYDFASATACEGCIAPKRSLGWDSMTTPALFVQVEYPTGGMLRYEWFGDISNLELFRRYIIVTEFPDVQTPSVFRQKYYSVAENNSILDGSDKRTIQSQIYEANGSVSDYAFEKIRDRYLLKRNTVTGNGQSIIKSYEWNFNEDGLSVDGIKDATMQVGSSPVFYLYQSDYDSRGRVIAKTDANGVVTRLAYVGDTTLVSGEQRSTTTTSYEYGGEDLCGRILQETWLRAVTRKIKGNTKTLQAFCYDDFGNVIKAFEGEPSAEEKNFSISYSESTPPLGTSQNVYDQATGLLLSQTDPYGVKAVHNYNKIGALIETKYPDGASVKHQYEVKNDNPQASNMITTSIHDITTGRDITIEKTFNGLDQLVQEKRGDQVTAYAYNSGGQISSIAYPDGRSIALSYDAFDRVTQKNISGLAPIQFQYAFLLEDFIPVQVTTVRIGNQPVQRLTHDLAGQLRKFEKLDDSGTALITTKYEYDPEGNLSKITSPASHQLLNAVDYKEGTATRTFPGGDTIIIDDPSGIGRADRITASNSTSEIQASLSYAAGGLLKEIRYSGAQNNLAMSYGAVGTKEFNRLTEVDDAAGKISFAYNSGGGVEVVERKLDALNETYKFYQVKDGFKNLTRLVYPNGLFVYYKRDDENRVTEVRKDSETGLLLASVQYAANNQPSEIKYANGMITSYAYDLAGRVKSITLRKGDKYTLQETYVYDALGRKMGVSHLDGSHEKYTYDPFNRLTKAEYYRNGASSSHSEQVYGYDLEGNRIFYKDSLKEIHYTADEASRITGYKIGPKDEPIIIGILQYDRGNLIQQTETQDGREILKRIFVYDDRNHLVSAKVDDAKNNFHTSSDYKYDYAGRRESVEVDGKKTHYLYGEALDPLMELDGDGEIKTFHIYLGSRKLADVSGDEIQFCHASELDNVLKVTDDGGNVVQTVRYDPFGNVNFLNGSDHNPFLFAGKQYDQSTGLYYFGARYYDPLLGRFLNRDPLYQGTNHYTYAENNPLTGKDIFGLWGFFVGVGGSFGGGDASLSRIGFSLSAGPVNFGLSSSLQDNTSLFASVGWGAFSLSTALPTATGENARFGLSAGVNGTESSIGVVFGGGDIALHTNDTRFGTNFLDEGLTDDLSLKDVVTHIVGWDLAPNMTNSRVGGDGALMSIVSVLDDPENTLNFSGVGSVDPYRETSQEEPVDDQEESNYPPKEAATNPQEVGNEEENDPKEKQSKVAQDKHGSNKSEGNGGTDPILLHSGDLLQT